MARGAASDHETRPRGRFPFRIGSRACLSAGAAAVLLAGCGGPARQDSDEPTGRYRVEVTEASFPDDQKLAKASRMTIAVRNVDTKTIPNLSVTVGTGAGGGGAPAGPSGFDYRDEAAEDPAKPIFVIDKEPLGGETAYVNTWALGAVKPGQTKTFNWDVTAVVPRPYNIRYRVSAGLDGKAEAVTVGGELPAGRFVGTVSEKAPDAKVARSGEDVIKAGETVEPRSPQD